MNTVAVVETRLLRGCPGNPVSCVGMGDLWAALPRHPLILANLASVLSSFFPAWRWVFTLISHFPELFPSPQSVMEPFHSHFCEHIGTLTQFC